MDVLGRIEEIVNKAIAAGERELPRNLMTKVTVLLREQVAEHAERERLVATATDTFGKRYAAQLRTALERSAAAAPTPPPPPVLPPTQSAPRPARVATPRPTSSGGGRRLTTRVVDSVNRQLSRVPEGLIVTFQGTSAIIEPPGIVLDNGRSFDAPGPAAMYVNRGEPINGWTAWKVSDGRSLQECWDSGDWPET